MRKDICSMLTVRWKEFNERLFYDYTMDIKEFKSLSKDTWQYFHTVEDKEKMYRYESELMSQMSPVVYLNQYPDDIGENLCQAAVRFVSEFITNLINPQNYYNRYNFWDGWIAFKPYNDYTDQYIHIDDFEKEFDKLCDEYYDENLM
ncbi:MAG: hypothetical protein IJ423_03495 [Clostridia bacterium]|nr:hypothetical protein [Clostridia bacterium]